VASIDGVDTPSGNLPLYFLLCHIIVLLSWQINSLSLSLSLPLSAKVADCYVFTFSVCLSVSMSVYPQETQKKLSCRWQTARCICVIRNDVADPPPRKTRPYFYHTECGRARSSSVGIGVQNFEDAGLRLPWDEAKLIQQKHAPHPRVTMPNFVVQGQTVRAYERRSTENPGPRVPPFQVTRGYRTQHFGLAGTNALWQWSIIIIVIIDRYQLSHITTHYISLLPVIFWLIIWLPVWDSEASRVTSRRWLNYSERGPGPWI